MDPFAEYLRELAQAVAKGDATEHTHRPALKALLQSLDDGVTATNEPKRIACGAPDFVLTRRQTRVGYVEAKDVGTNLDTIKRDSERREPASDDGKQLKRYRDSLGNLLLTDYLDFRWFVDGTQRAAARLASPQATGKLSIEDEGVEKVSDLLQSFYALRVPSVGTPKELAERMARLSAMVRGLNCFCV